MMKWFSCAMILFVRHDTLAAVRALPMKSRPRRLMMNYVSGRPRIPNQKTKSIRMRESQDLWQMA